MTAMTPKQKSWHQKPKNKKRKIQTLKEWIKDNSKRRKLIALRSYHNRKIKEITEELERMKLEEVQQRSHQKSPTSPEPSSHPE